MAFCTCIKCGHEWKSRGDSIPKKCANRNCQTSFWNYPKKGEYAPKLDLSKIKAELSMRYARMAVANMQNMYKSDPDWDESWSYIFKNISKIKGD